MSFIETPLFALIVGTLWGSIGTSLIFHSGVNWGSRRR